ncbi:TPA: pertactin-like passenger domain-containing protein, partial [Escherichia coli]
ISGQASGLLLENGGSFTVNAGGQASNTTVGHRGTLTLAAGGSLSGRTQLSKGASMVLNGDVVSTGDIVNAGEIRFDNQTTQDAVLSRAVAKGDAPVTFHKLTTSNLTGQGGTINMRVRLDGSNASDQLVINGGQATGKTWLAFTNVGNSNLGVATSGQGIRVVDAQNGATTEEGAFALSRPLQAGAFNYTLNRDSDEDWYLRSENAYRAEVPLYASMLTQAMDYDRILAGSRSHQTGVNGENNSVRLSIQGGHLGHDNNGGIARGATPESSGSYGFVHLESDLLRTEVAGMSVTAGGYGAAGHSSVDVKNDDGSRAGTVRDDAGSLGGYLNLTHTSSGLWADIVAQGTRHSMKASSDNNDFRARGWGWLGS